MKLTIPLYICSHQKGYTVRLLFFPTPVESDTRLERALERLTRELRKHFGALGEKLRHDELMRYSFSPPLEYHRLDVALELHRRRARARFLFVVFAALGRRVAFTPSLPELWFELDRDDLLSDRAPEVLTHYFRRLEHEDEEDFTQPEELSLAGTAWVSNLDLEIFPRQRINEEDTDRWLLGEAQPVSGEHELFRVGRCLDHLFPEELDRVILREHELAELTRLLNAPDRRPVLLVGPPLVGKTALLHEYVFRKVQSRKERHRLENLTWLLSPQRLISGMSFVGQWENRLLAIIKEAQQRQHLLYVDNILGLYQAGVHCQSDLSVAHVLKPFVERREVRFLAEMTPEVLRIFRERDRGFADLFHVLPVPELTEAENMRILISSQRQLEGQYRCRFAAEAVPAVIDLQRRYARHLSFPGKAALFLRRLAVKYPEFVVTRAQVFAEFQAKSGLNLAFLDPRSKLERSEILEALGRQIIGQPAPLQAVTDVIGIARARINDPDRPLGSFLFLGPTGVGKTQTAKALASYLFGNADKLVRFDMNEFLTPGSAARLVGTFYQPEGLLTSAVRRQPFAVVLLDEIEKAHPEVFDLLLQVLGEGRLTDAHGRLTDFSNTIIILTSNLGVREAEASLGFKSEAAQSAFTQAAQRFFRPEFFNRLDRIVPFNRLGREEVWHIAEWLIQEVLQREGLVRRKCVLRVEETALQRIVDQGYDPQLGARALKRAVERYLTRPVARRLAEGLPETITLIHLYLAGNEMTVRVEGLSQAEPVPTQPEPDQDADLLGRLQAVARRALAQIEPFRPTAAITAETAGQYAPYFEIKHQAETLLKHIRLGQEKMESQREITSQAIPGQIRSRRSAGKLPHEKTNLRHFLRELAAAQDIQSYLQDLIDIAENQEVLVNSRDIFDGHDPVWSVPILSLSQLLAEMALLHTMTDALFQGLPPRALVTARAENTLAERWLELLPIWMDYMGTGSRDPGPPPRHPNLERTLVLHGVAAVPMAKCEEGTHIFCPRHGGLAPIEVRVWPVAEGVDPADVYGAQQWQREEWLGRRTAGEWMEEDPLRLLPVRRLYHEDGKTVDLRTGLASPKRPRLKGLILATLPLPPELTERL